MTPEQEDAHWALTGKPLMRHWLARAKLCAEGSRLCAEGNRLWAEGDKLRADGDKLRAEGAKRRAEGTKLCAEGDRLRAEGTKLCAEGNGLWADAVIVMYGKDCIMGWRGGGCEVAGVLYTTGGVR